MQRGKNFSRTILHMKVETSPYFEEGFESLDRIHELKFARWTAHHNFSPKFLAAESEINSYESKYTVWRKNIVRLKLTIRV